jgi:ring-1,2-phenylacetyl-CoA epoxidase subunit PaaD
MQLPEPSYSQETIGKILELVKDPEIPVLTVEDMGIIRGVEVTENAVCVSITPTYSGCPAMDLIADEIQTTLTLHGYNNVQVKTVLSPAWSSDFITAQGRKRMEEFGIAPPSETGSRGAMLGVDPVSCPQCKSVNTSIISEFGSTACKALYKCKDCLEPFDYFKCV